MSKTRQCFGSFTECAVSIYFSGNDTDVYYSCLKDRHIGNIDLLGCRIAIDVIYNRTYTDCFCDTNLCNIHPFNYTNYEAFSCYAGDLDFNSLDQTYNTNFRENFSPFSFQIRDCYTNIKMCFQIKYRGKFDLQLLTMQPCSILALSYHTFRALWRENCVWLCP